MWKEYISKCSIEDKSSFIKMSLYKMFSMDESLFNEQQLNKMLKANED